MEAQQRIRPVFTRTLSAVAAITAASWIFFIAFPNAFSTAFVPCAKPITYSIGSVDPHFGLSAQQLAQATEDAQAIWDKAYGKQLFAYRANGKGDLQVNLIYNGLQSETQSLAQLNKRISANTQSYGDLKKTYDQEKANYEQKKQAYDAALSSYNQQRADYEKQVNYWNQRGGAPDPQYEQLQQQKTNLIQQQNQLNQQQQDLDQIAANVNALAAQLNKLAASHNSDVSVYNSSNIVGKEFNEGMYIQDDSGKHIEIYQFDNHDKLVRVLAHELGHALGLEHVDDPKAIMYRLNQSQNDTPTQADMAELRALCSGASLTQKH